MARSYDKSVYKKLELPTAILFAINSLLAVYQIMVAPLYFRVGEVAVDMLRVNFWLTMVIIAWTIFLIIAEWRIRSR